MKYEVGYSVGDITIKSITVDKIEISCVCGRDRWIRKDSFRRTKTTCICPKCELLTVGEKHGRLTLIEKISDNGSFSKWKCRCECGKDKHLIAKYIVSGSTSSCGCSSWSIKKDDEDLVINDYAAGLRIEDLCNKYKFGAKQIRDMMKRRGIRRRGAKLPIDETIFDSLTRNSMYWMGMIASDGNVFNNRVSIGLQDSDIGHLQKLKEFCKSEHAIVKSNASNVFGFRSPKVARSLAKFGIMPNKSLTYNPYWYFKNNADFWRGMVDGDGSIRIDKDGTLRFSLCGSKEAVYAFSEWAKTKCETKASPRQRGNIYIFDISANMAKKVCAALYGNNPKYYLERKAKVAEKALGIKLPAYAV